MPKLWKLRNVSHIFIYIAKVIQLLIFIFLHLKTENFIVQVAPLSKMTMTYLFIESMAENICQHSLRATQFCEES